MEFAKLFHRGAILQLALLASISLQGLSLSCHTNDPARNCIAPIDVVPASSPEECCSLLGGDTYLKLGRAECMECIVYGFEETALSVTEGDKVEVGIRILKGDGRRIVLELTELHSTTSDSDFRLGGSRRVVLRQGRRVKRLLRIMADELAEDSEVLQLHLRAVTSLLENEFLVNLLNITISDEKVLSVKFSRARYSCTEGDGRAVVTLTRQPELAKDFIIVISPLTFLQARNRGLTAFTRRSEASSADFMGEDIELLLPASDTAHIAHYTVEVPIVNDNINEDIEEFMLILSAGNNSVHKYGVNFDNNGRAACKIVDDDFVGIGFGTGSHSIAEDHGVLTLSIVRFPIGRPSEQDFVLELEVSAVSPNFNPALDLQNPVLRNVTFPAKKQEISIQIAIAEDSVPEDTETFKVEISEGLGCRGARDCNRYTEVTIADNDILTVGFEQEEIEVDIDDGFGELCVSISSPKGPAERQFTLEALHFHTSTIIFATAIIPLSESLEFSSEQHRACFNATVSEDESHFGQHFEGYTVSLLAVDREPLVIISPDEATVIIARHEITFVQFDNYTYGVGEADGSVEVCVELLGPLRDVAVQISTHNRNAIDGNDYTSISQLGLSLHENNELECVLIEIIDDSISEEPQSFTVALEVPQATGGVEIATPIATVVIFDNDLEVTANASACGVDHPDLSHAEEEDRKALLKALQSILPELLMEVGDIDDKTLEEIYEQFAEVFSSRPSKTGYNRFIEAVSVLAHAKYEACSADDSKLTAADVPQLIVDFKLAYSTGLSGNLEDARAVAGRMLCVEIQLDPEVDSCTNSTCECPESRGLDEVICPCEFFTCLDQEGYLTSILGLDNQDAFPCVAFIIDTTGSMRDEIDFARGVITSFAQQQQKNSNLCFMLVPFSDNGDASNSVGPIIFTDTKKGDNLTLFYTALGELTAFGGRDPPEYAFDAILQALQYTYTTQSGAPVRALEEGSHVVVLTDAPSKRVELVDEIVREASKNGICVHLFLQNYEYFSTFGYSDTFDFSDYVATSGRGSGSEEEEYAPQYEFDFSGYDRVDVETAGSLVKRIDSSSLSQFMETFQKGTCDDLSSPGFTQLDETSAKRSECSVFLVSKLASSVRVAITVFQEFFSFELPTISVFHPDGSETTADFATQDLALISLDSPQPGEWTVCIDRGTISLAVYPQYSLNAVVLHPVGDGSFVSTSPVICASSVAVVTSQASLMSSVDMQLASRISGEVIHSETMTICGGTLTANSNTAIPEGTLSYHLVGVDTLGIPFEYDMRKSTYFTHGAYSLTTLGGPSTTIEIDSTFTLSFELTSYSNSASHFDFSFEAKGFSSHIIPHRVTLLGGGTVRIQVQLFITSVAVRPGSTHTFSLTASTSCKSLSAAKRVTLIAQEVAILPSFVCDCENGGTCSVSIFRGRLYRTCLCPQGFYDTHCHLQEKE